MSDMYLSDAAAHDHIPGCDANCFGASTCMGSAEPIPGRWVPWCVEHGSTQDGEHTWESVCPEGWDSEDCRWHPLGAFIPEEGGTT